jgi:methionyl-tRNA formyltransferase
MQKLKLAFFGTPDFAAYLLERIILDKDLPIDLKLVVTQPDRPVGRKQILTSSPVKIVAQKYTIPLSHKPEDICNHEIDLVLLFAYGAIIKKGLLEAPKYSFWNIHPSLLPKYRNTSPVAYALLLGEKKTGVTLMKMDEKLDHGQIILQQTVEIKDNENQKDLLYRLTDLAFDIFKQSLAHTFPPLITEQKHTDATYTKMLKRDNGFIPLPIIKKAINADVLTQEELPDIIRDYLGKYPNTSYSSFSAAEVVNNMFKGLYGWPGIWTKIIEDGIEKRMKITDIELKDNKLIILKVQIEGKIETDFSGFMV